MSSNRKSTQVKSAMPQAMPRLLVIEDDPDQQELIVETLEDQFGPGCATVAGTCAAARAADLAAFDLVLCDVNLPDGNGLDLLGDLLASGRPTMMLTGENDKALAREAIGRGAVDYVVKAGSYLLTMPITVEKNLAAGDVAARHRADLADAEQRASTDPMTGCYNRRAFEAVFGQLFAEAYRTGGELCCVMVDLDKFKQVNDTLGHAAGDDLIKAAASSIRANLRQMDVACRYGGDEFVLLFPQTGPGQASAVADRVRRDYAVASARLLEGEAKTMSIGVGSLSRAAPRPSGPEALMAVADAALYEAKEAGRDRICTAA